MTESYCPFLRRELERLYVCAALDSETNPLVMPCLSKYEDCVVYRAFKGRRGLSATAEPEVAKVAAAQPASGAGEPREAVVVDKISELERLLRAFLEEAAKVRRLREEYRRSVERLRGRYEELQELVGELMSRVLEEVPEVAQRSE